MAYNRVKIYQQAIDAIKKNNLFSIEDIVAFLPCDKTTFYRFFPIDCNENNNLKALLEENKIKTKSAIRAKLFQGKGSELIALYKLIATVEERKILADKFDDIDSNKDFHIENPNKDE
jgi:hypothetical protein